MTPPDGDRHALLRTAAARLPGDTPRLDAELLLAHALGEARLAMLAGREPVDDAAQQRFAALVERRRRHEPVAYILEEREFWSLPLHVTPDVLVPRADSETLIAAALDSGVSPRHILDLGTGSGALLLAALSEWPEALGFGVDRSPGALAVARENARRLGLDQRALFMVADWADALAGRFDLLLCNPPYVETGAGLSPDVAEYEPHGALFAGPDGLDEYRKLLPKIRSLLRAGGVAIFEFGAGQQQALARLAAESGLDARFRHDLSGKPRALILR